MARCIVIGAPEHSGPTAKLLTQGDVPSKAVANLSESVKLIQACVQEPELEVVAVYCRDFPDQGITVLEALKQHLRKGVQICVLKEGDRDAEPTKSILHALKVSDIFGLSIGPSDAAESLKKRFFNGHAVSVSKLSQEAVRLGLPPAVQKLTPVEQETFRRHKNVLPPLDLSTALPTEPIVKSLVGKHDMIMQLDPRRIRTLKGQPRTKNNPGFKSESIERLSKGMKKHGQADDALVCPIIDDPRYDAQLIDGERRYRSALQSGSMLRVKVMEGVDPNDERALWLIAVIRNNSKAPATTLEQMEIVTKLREKYGYTIEGVADFLGVSSPTVVRFSNLMKLAPEVRAMLDDAVEEDDTPRRRLTSQLALLLIDFAPKEQVAKAKHLVSTDLSYDQARLYVIGERRKAGLKPYTGEQRRGWQAQMFGALETLAASTNGKFDIYLQMPRSETLEMVESRTDAERSRLGRRLRDLSGCLAIMADRIDPKNNKKK